MIGEGRFNEDQDFQKHPPFENQYSYTNRSLLSNNTFKDKSGALLPSQEELEIIEYGPDTHAKAFVKRSLVVHILRYLSEVDQIIL